jgi:hypothetical protein
MTTEAQSSGNILILALFLITIGKLQLVTRLTNITRLSQ